MGEKSARYEGVPGAVPSDVDVLFIGTADIDDVEEVLTEAQRLLRREVNVRKVAPGVHEHWRQRGVHEEERLRRAIHEEARRANGKRGG